MSPGTAPLLTPPEKGDSGKAGKKKGGKGKKEFSPCLKAVGKVISPQFRQALEKGARLLIEEKAH